MKLIIANWKANKNVEEAESWVHDFLTLLKADADLQRKVKSKSVRIVIAPSYQLLHPVRQLLPKEIALCSQDVSFYERGSYTGEVAASALRGLAEYSILGHSERRKYFHETNNTVDQKVALAMDNDIEPVLCVRGPQDLIPKGVLTVAYEPEWAIGTGKNADLKTIIDMKKTLPLNDGSKFLYGGSVDEDSIKEYLGSAEIDGFLVGSASNKAENFYKMASLL